MKRVNLLFGCLLISSSIYSQTQTQDLNMGLYQLQFPSANGGSNRIQSYGGSYPGTWLFKSRFDNIILDAGENESNKYQILLKTGNIERARINANGNFGIGTISPIAKFSVQSSGTIGAGNYSNSSVYITDGNQKMGIDPNQIYAGQDFNIDATTYLRFVTAGTERLKILQNGNVGIGASNPVARLSIQSSGTIGGGNYQNSSLYVTDGNQKMGIDPNQIYAGQDFNIDATTYLRFATAGTERLRILQNGNIGIGTTTTGSHKLAVEGSIGAREIKVEATGWSDFVFEKDYKLRTLEEVEEHIAKKGHLPEIPSEKEVTENGINLGEMDAKLLQKIEELTLYMIDMNKQMKTQTAELENMKAENSKLKKEVSALKNE